MATTIKVTLPGGTSESHCASETPVNAIVSDHGDLTILDNNHRAVAGYASGQWLSFKSDSEQSFTS